MEPSLNWLAIVLLIGAAHALFLAITLVNIRGGNHTANRILALAFVIFAVLIGLHLVTHTHFLLRVPHLSKVASPITFLLLPLFYFYVRALTSSATHFQLNKETVLHFVPFFIAIAYHAPYYLESTEYKVAHIMDDYQGLCMLCHLNHWFAVAQMLVYLVFITRMLVSHSNRIKNSFSYIEKINLNWLKLLFVAFAGTWVLSLLLQFFTADHDAVSYVWLVVAINIYLIGYLGLRQPLIFAGASGMMVTAARTSGKKYEKSTLKPEKAEEYLAKLLDFMEREKPFLDDDLTLQSLARKLSMSHHHLSQVINEKLHQNFFEFINGHRVEESKKLLTEPKNRNLNIAQIGFEAGFKSISAFNAAFKKHAELTPSQYLEQVTSK